MEIFNIKIPILVRKVTFMHVHTCRSTMMKYWSTVIKFEMDISLTLCYTVIQYVLISHADLKHNIQYYKILYLLDS